MNMRQEPTKLRKASNAYSIFILVLTILSLAVMVAMLLPLPESTLSLLRFYDTVICVIFLIDFFLILRQADKKSDYLIGQRGWLDLIGSLPSLGILRMGGLLRLARLSRLMRIARRLGREERRALVRDVLNNRSEYGLFVTIFVTILVLTVASVLVLQFESTSPEANIITGWDSLWYSIVTITTVGYGDYHPGDLGAGYRHVHHVRGRRHHRRPCQYSRQLPDWVIVLCQRGGGPAGCAHPLSPRGAQGRQGRAGPHASDAGEIGRRIEPRKGLLMVPVEMTMAKDSKKDRKTREKLETAEIEAAAQAAEASEPAPKLRRKEFEKELEPLQVELVRMQEWVKASGAKICVLFEGRDAAGKGGIIKRITERTSPRVFRVVALAAPTEREKTQMYFQRYMPICRQPAKWFSSIAVGTTGRVSNG